MTDTPASTVWPSLSYDDGPAAIEFLTTVLGFRATAVYAGDDPQQIQHAQLDWPEGGGIMLGSGSRPDGWVDPRGHASVYVVTADPDSVCARAAAAGCRVLREPRDEDYGGRSCVLLDPEGNQWSFGSYRGELASAE